MTPKEITELIYNTLLQKYKTQALDKHELASELHISVSCVNKRIMQGYGLPDYKKGNGKCGRIRFPIINVAKFIAENNIRVACF